MKGIFEEFTHIIMGVESSSTVEKYGFKFLKMKLRLVDVFKYIANRLK